METISANSRPTIIEREPVQQSQQGLDPQVLLDLNSQWSRSQLDLQAKLDEMAQKVSNDLFMIQHIDARTTVI